MTGPLSGPPAPDPASGEVERMARRLEDPRAAVIGTDIAGTIVY